MVRLRLKNGRYVWLQPGAVQAVAPNGDELNETLIVMSDGFRLLVEGIADEIGRHIADTLCGNVPAANAPANA